MADKKDSKEANTSKAAADKPAKAPKVQAQSESATPKAIKQAKAEGKPSRPALVEKTFFAKVGEVPAKWRLIDATGQTLGRLSAAIAMALMGKDKATYTRSSDTGDFVIVINAEKVKLTGNKLEGKTYHYHTNYPGGIKTFTAMDLMRSHPERIIERAVYGMLPKGHMGRRWYKKLRVFVGPDHPHQAQTPQPVTLRT